MKKVTVSAPGKLMLLGEHAVVYGHPCLVTAVGQRMYVTISKIKYQKSKINTIRIDAPGEKISGYQKPFNELGKGEIPKGVRFVEIAVKNFFDFVHVNPRHPGRSAATDRISVRDSIAPLAFRSRMTDAGITITTKSEFSSKFGFGSSSAATVCTIKALAELFNAKLSKKQIFDLSYKTVLDIQGKGSGFDVAAAVYGGTLYFVTGGKKIEQIISPRHSEAKPKNLLRKKSRSFANAQDDNKRNLPLMVGYSGIKADTVTLINQVAEKAKKYPDIVENIYKHIAKIVDIARIALEKQDWSGLGEMMNINQGYLESLGVSTDKLSAMIYAALDAGAFGAKLSGAGGGDCMIALSEKGKAGGVKKAIERAGGEVIDVEVNAEGVKVE